jgi:hypothetical protein
MHVVVLDVLGKHSVLVAVGRERASDRDTRAGWFSRDVQPGCWAARPNRVVRTLRPSGAKAASKEAVNVAWRSRTRRWTVAVSGQRLADVPSLLGHRVGRGVVVVPAMLTSRRSWWMKNRMESRRNTTVSTVTKYRQSDPCPDRQEFCPRKSRAFGRRVDAIASPTQSRLRPQRSAPALSARLLLAAPRSGVTVRGRQGRSGRHSASRQGPGAKPPTCRFEGGCCPTELPAGLVRYRHGDKRDLMGRDHGQ